MGDSTSSVGQVIKDTIESTDSNSLNKTIATVTTDSNSNGYGYWNDSIYAEIPDLVNDAFRAWYCDAFYKLGKNRTLGFIVEARREGKNPARYFSHLLKTALKEH